MGVSPMSAFLEPMGGTPNATAMAAREGFVKLEIAEEVRPMPKSDTAPPRAHVSSLDGLRAIAVLGVMYYHTRLPWFQFGWIGVDLFFVLSGFLITTLLVKDRKAKGKINLPKFWGRRFLRLMPAYWLFVGVCTILILRGVGAIDLSTGWSARRYLLSLWLYFTNYAPGNVWAYQDISGPLWSLAVEEQFYFVWPFVCALTFRFTRRGWVVGWLLVAATALCRYFSPNDFVLHTMLYTRGIGIIAGAAVALSLAEGLPAWVARGVRSAAVRVGLMAGSAVFVVVATWLTRHFEWEDDDLPHKIFVPIAAALFPCVVVVLWYGPADWIARGLSWMPIAYVGRISYGIYLYHALFKWLVWDQYPGATADMSQAVKVGLRLAAYFGGTIGLATVSYYGVEKPFLRLKERLR